MLLWTPSCSSPGEVCWPRCRRVALNTVSCNLVCVYTPGTYFAIFYILHFLSLDLFQVPYLGLGPELTPDYEDRSATFSVVQVCVACVCAPKHREHASSQNVVCVWQVFSIIGILFGAVLPGIAACKCVCCGTWLTCAHTRCDTVCAPATLGRQQGFLATGGLFCIIMVTSAMTLAFSLRVRLIPPYYTCVLALSHTPDTLQPPPGAQGTAGCQPTSTHPFPHAVLSQPVRLLPWLQPQH